MLDLGFKGCKFETYRRHCVVFFEQVSFFLAVVQPKKTGNCPAMTEKLLTGI